MALLMEIGWGGLVQYPWTITWTDVSQYVHMGQGVSIDRGASDEVSEINPGTMTAKFDNADGRFTAGNPNSPYWPFVRRNAPVRVGVTMAPARTGAAPWPVAQLTDDFDNGVIDPVLWPGTYGGATEAAGRARVPAAAGTPAGFLSGRQWTLAGSQFAVKTTTLPRANGSTTATASLMLNSTTAGTRVGITYSPVTGTIRFVNETGGNDGSAVEVDYESVDYLWWRLREDSGTLYWETSGDGTEWTVQRTRSTPSWVSTQQVTVELSAARTGGTADTAEFDLANHTPAWRFWGVLNDVPVTWAGLDSTVTVTASDLFKRLNRLPALRSALAEEILNDVDTGWYTLLSAYFPLTEDADSTSAGDISGSSSVGSITATQLGTGGTLDFGADGLPATGDTCLSLAPASATAGLCLTGDLGAGFESASAVTNDHTLLSCSVEVWFQTSTAGRAICGLYDTALDNQLVLALNASGVLTVESTAVGGSLTVVTIGTANLADGNWHHIVHDNSALTVYIDGVRYSGPYLISSVYGLRNLHLGGYRGARLFSGQIGHLAVHHANAGVGGTWAAHYTAGMTGFAGEPADQRIERLARYAGIGEVTIWGTTHDAIASQGESGTGALARMQEVETTESARLFAERDYFGLAYQSRDVRYNPDPADETFVIDYADLETLGVELADDDQKLVNSVQGSRPGGATQRAIASESVLAYGLYEQQLNLLKTSDNSVLDAAYWLVSRYADPAPELREVPIEAYTHPLYADILDAGISSYFTVTDLPAQAPASEMRVTVEGYTEVIKTHSHLITFRTSNAAQDSVWVLDDATYSVLDYTTRCAY